MNVSRWVTIDEAVRLTGLSRRALEGRVERGSVKSKRRGRRRVVSLVSLYERGLIPLDPGHAIGELLDRLEAQAKTIGELEERLRRTS